MEYDKDNLRNQWMSCEGRCGKWFCSNCSMFTIRFDCVTNMNIFEFLYVLLFFVLYNKYII